MNDEFGTHCASRDSQKLSIPNPPSYVSSIDIIYMLVSNQHLSLLSIPTVIILNQILVKKNPLGANLVLDFFEI
jgi:hypothetical protein